MLPPPSLTKICSNGYIIHEPSSPARVHMTRLVPYVLTFTSVSRIVTINNNVLSTRMRVSK